MSEVPPGPITRTLTAPVEADAGDTAVICVSESTETSVPADVPKVTAVAPVKPLPVTVTVVPPVFTPVDGLTPYAEAAAWPVAVAVVVDAVLVDAVVVDAMVVVTVLVEAVLVAAVFVAVVVVVVVVVEVLADELVVVEVEVEPDGDGAKYHAPPAVWLSTGPPTIATAPFLSSPTADPKSPSPTSSLAVSVVTSANLPEPLAAKTEAEPAPPLRAGAPTRIRDESPEIATAPPKKPPVGEIERSCAVSFLNTQTAPEPLLEPGALTTETSDEEATLFPNPSLPVEAVGLRRVLCAHVLEGLAWLKYQAAPWPLLSSGAPMIPLGGLPWMTATE